MAGKRPYVETNAPAQPEGDAWTPAQLQAECAKLAHRLGGNARVSVSICADLEHDFCSGLSLSIYPHGTGGQHLYVTSTDFPSLFAEAERHIADYHAHRQDRAREALAQARAEAERLGVAETV